MRRHTEQARKNIGDCAEEEREDQSADERYPVEAWRRRGSNRSRFDGHRLPFSPRSQWSQARRLEIVAVEKIVRVERNQAAVRMDDVYAGFLDRTKVECLRVDELHDQNAKDVAIRDVAARQRLRHA